MQEKKCKECWIKFTRYNTIQNKCNKCVNKINKQKPLKSYKPLKQKSKTNKNTTAKFNTKTKWEIKERDEYCIICWQEWTDFHHIYFSQEAEYWKDRNNSDKWVLLCRLCHWKAHWCKRWEWVRQECILYIKEYYG